MIEPNNMRVNFIVPALRVIGLFSEEAEKILMGTAAIESDFQFVIQKGGGPALGLFQMEPATYIWLMNGFLASKHYKDLKAKVLTTATVSSPAPQHMMHNHKFAASMARVRYFAAPGHIPKDLDGQAHYWSKYYNGESPHGLRPVDYIRRWDARCANVYSRN